MAALWVGHLVVLWVDLLADWMVDLSADLLAVQWVVPLAGQLVD